MPSINLLRNLLAQSPSGQSLKSSSFTFLEQRLRMSFIIMRLLHSLDECWVPLLVCMFFSLHTLPAAAGASMTCSTPSYAPVLYPDPHANLWPAIVAHMTLIRSYYTLWTPLASSHQDFPQLSPHSCPGILLYSSPALNGLPQSAFEAQGMRWRNHVASIVFIHSLKERIECEHEVGGNTWSVEHNVGISDKHGLPVLVIIFAC
ncbi:hypothetical protein EDB19DRAFT_1836386 [Suillus lakei]|nr:hypothetical protein EDB19DRAFT_1836386 [Suillus lakei]